MTEQDKNALDNYLTAKFKATVLTEDEKQQKKGILRNSLSEDLTHDGVFSR